MIGLQIPLRRVDKLLSAESPWFGNMTAFMRDVSATYLSYGSRNNNDSSSSKSSPIQDKTLVWVQTKYFTKLSWLMDIYLEVRMLDYVY